MAEPNAFVGRIFLERGDNGSPIAYTRACDVFNISGIGETNEQIESTTFCSDGTKEYISGLADGSELTLELNFRTDPANVQRAMIQDVKNKAVRSFRVVCDEDGDGTPEMGFYFDATCLSWTFAPSASAKNTITFTFKISGSIDIVDG